MTTIRNPEHEEQQEFVPIAEPVFLPGERHWDEEPIVEPEEVPETVPA